MKHLYLVFLCLSLALAACESQEAEKNNTSPTQEAWADAPVVLKDHAPIVQKIMLKEQGALRGFEIGDSLSLVQDYERAELLEDSLQAASYVIYTIDLGKEEMADIRYEFDSEKHLKTILIDIFYKDIASLTEQFKTFFDQKYGAAALSEAGVWEWQSRRGYRIRLRQERNPAAAGIQIEIK